MIFNPGPVSSWTNYRNKRFWCVAVLITYALAGFFLLPWVVRNQSVAVLGEVFSRPVHLERVRCNPFALTLEADGFAIREDDGSLILGFDRLFVNFQLSSLFHWALTFRQIELDGLDGEVVRHQDGETNFQRMLPKSEKATDTESSATVPRLIIHRLIVSKARLGVVDLTREPDFFTEIGPLDVQIDDISTLPNRTGDQHLLLKTEGDGVIEWNGNLQLNPLDLRGNTVVDGRFPVLAARYFQEMLAVDVPEGTAHLEFNYKVAQTSEGISADLEKIAFSINGLQVIDRVSQERILRLPELKLLGGSLSLLDKTVKFSKVALENPELQAWRNADGSINLEHLLKKENDSASAVTEASPPIDANLTEEQPWTLNLQELSLSGLRLDFEDRSLRKPAPQTIESLKLTVSDISNVEKAAFPFSGTVSFAPSGNVKLDGHISVLPTLTLNAQLAVDALPVSLAQPQILDYLNVAVKGGTVDLVSSLRISPDEIFSVSGEASVNGINIADGFKQEKLLGWKELSVDQFDLSLTRRSLDISSLKLDKIYANLRIAEDQTTNINRLIVEGEKLGSDESAIVQTAHDVGSAQAETSPAFAVKLGEVVFDDGSADFSDLALPIPFRTRVSGLDGKITTLDTASSQPAIVRLDGQVADYGQARVKGSLLPLGPKQDTDISLLFRNVELPDMTPYTIKFVGRKIDEGRMDLDLRYRINNGKLKAANKIVLRKLELGDSVEQKGAMKLPLDLAVALLTGPDGKIDIDVPIEGDVDSPDFELSGVISRAFGNLITGIAASPFKMLASLIGIKSENLDRLQFEQGYAELTPPEKEKVQHIADALLKRPELKLKVPAVYAAAADTQALKEIKVDGRVEAQLQAESETEKKGVLLSDRRIKILERIAKNQMPDLQLDSLRNSNLKPADPGKPDEKTVLDDTAYAAALRDLLVAVEPVTNEELLVLARARAQSVIAALTAGNSIPESRVEITAPVAIKADKSGWLKAKLELDVLKK